MQHKNKLVEEIKNIKLFLNDQPGTLTRASHTQWDWKYILELNGVINGYMTKVNDFLTH